MITPYASEIALHESNCLISDETLQISLKKVTIKSILNILKLETLAVTYQEKAPFTFQILHTKQHHQTHTVEKKQRGVT